MTSPIIQHDDTDELLDLGWSGSVLSLAGEADSGYQLVIHDVPVDRQMTVFAGVDGAISEHLGTRPRPIMITGDLRVSSAALAVIRAQRDRIKAITGTWTMIDDLGEVYANCQLDRFEIGPRMQITGAAPIKWIASYSLVLLQMKVNV